MSRRYGGFTSTELIAVLVVIAVATLFVGILISARGGRCRGTRQLKDSTQVRGIQQALVVFAQNNADRYPLPSLLDKDGATIAGDAAAKDTTANIFSILLFQGMVAPEMFINPAEANGHMKVADQYEFDNPTHAVTPTKALWDPTFSTDFTNGRTANNSYAHILPSGVRLEKKWMNSFGSTDPVVGNRGPEVKSVTYDATGKAKPNLVLGDQSITFLIHGKRNAWEGNIAFNDNHVEFLQSIAPDALTYTTKDGKKRGDVIFYDEPDDAGGADAINRYLGIFTKAGPTPKDFTAIWD
jgi:hypothetical protein